MSLLVGLALESWGVWGLGGLWGLGGGQDWGRSGRGLGAGEGGGLERQGVREEEDSTGNRVDTQFPVPGYKDLDGFTTSTTRFPLERYKINISKQTLPTGL